MRAINTDTPEEGRLPNAVGRLPDDRGRLAPPFREAGEGNKQSRSAFPCAARLPFLAQQASRTIEAIWQWQAFRLFNLASVFNHLALALLAMRSLCSLEGQGQSAPAAWFRKLCPEGFALRPSELIPPFRHRCLQCGTIAVAAAQGLLCAALGRSACSFRNHRRSAPWSSLRLRLGGASVQSATSSSALTSAFGSFACLAASSPSGRSSAKTYCVLSFPCASPAEGKEGVRSPMLCRTHGPSVHQLPSGAVPSGASAGQTLMADLSAAPSAEAGLEGRTPHVLL